MLARLKRLLAGTLRRQLTVGMVLLVSSMMSLFVWDMTRRQQAVELEQQSGQAVALARSVATSASVWVASRDFSGLQEIVQGIASNYPDLRHAIVLDLRGQVLAHSDPSRRGLYLGDLPQDAAMKILQRTASLVDVVSPVMLSGHQIGWVRIGLGQDSVNAQLARMTHDGIVYALIAIALSALVATLAGWYLTRRLHAIRQTADAVQGGDSTRRAQVAGDDEAAQLAQRFNGMLDSLAQREEALRESHETLRSILATTLDGYWLVDAQGRLLDVNTTYAQQSGYTREELLRMRIPDLEAVENPSETAARIRRLIASGDEQWESRHRRKDGSIWHVEVSTTHRDVAGGRIFAFLRDISERKRAEADLRIAATAFESQMGMTITDAAQVILRVNKSFTEITGYSAKEAIGQTPRILNSGRHDRAFFGAIWESVAHTGSWQGEIWNRRKSGEVYPEWLTITAVKDDAGLATHYVGAFSDITPRKTAEAQIRNLAFYDTLTQLPNRRLLMDRLRQSLAAGARHPRKGALLFVDLDHFKAINDTVGHYQGDLLLEQVAKRLTSCVRESDTVARLGGDEFVVMLEDLSVNALDAATEAESVARKVLAALDQVYQLGTYEHHTTSSIGITLFGGDPHESIDEPLKRADMAMYQAKAAGRNTLRFFDPQMQAEVTARAELEAGLREALAKNQFHLHYQAQVSGGREVTGVEALVRWKHPQRGLVWPGEFIAVAEESGLIVPLGRWVLETACAQLALWAARPETAHLTIAVNVSARQFHQDGFVDQVVTTLEDSGANPQRLKLELTESLLVARMDDVVAKMMALKARGVSFALDDFGTGYSSLVYLKRLPLSQLKIDRGFVRDILIDPNDAAIAKMLIVLAESLGLSVIAEGVETVAQGEFLAAHGCDAYQGYLFSRPMPIKEFEELLRNR